MTRNQLFVSVIALAAAQFSLAAEAPKKIASVEGITEYNLDNGLRVLLFPDSSQAVLNCGHKESPLSLGQRKTSTLPTYWFNGRLLTAVNPP